MKQRLLALIILFLNLGALCELSAQRKFSFSENIGVAVQDNDSSACLSVKRANIQRREYVVLICPVVPDKGFNSSIAGGEILSRYEGPVENPGINELGDSVYRVRIVRGKMVPNAAYFAVFASPELFSGRGAEIHGDLDGDGKPEYFRQCTSSEGVHLTIWSGRPLKGTRRWHCYFYLGYDVEPNCTEAEYEE